MPRPYGYTSAACVRACGGSGYVELRDNGNCHCRAARPASPAYAELEPEDCGEVCETEETLLPKRFCGTPNAFAAYRLESPAEAAKELSHAKPGADLFGLDVAPGWPTKTRDMWPQVDLLPGDPKPPKHILKGVAYGPVPLRTHGRVPDDDFMAEAVDALWGPQGRHDLSVIRSLGANSVRLYGNDPSLDHTKFLDEAMRQGLEVIVGISDYPYTQMQGNCISTNFDCYSQVKAQYSDNLKRGFLTAGNIYHPALRTIILMNEPDLKFPGGPANFVKAVVSAIDAVLDVEKEVGIAGQAPSLTVTFSFGVCGHQCPEYGRAPALGQMLALRRAMRHPASVGYVARNDVWAAYETRFMNSMNTANPATDLPWLFLHKYDALFPKTPVFIGEYHSPRTVDQKRDLQQILAIARNESSMLMGIMFFEFQVRYDKGGSEMSFGMFGLDSRHIRRMEIRDHPYKAYCLKPLPVAEVSGRSRRTDCADIEAGVDYVTDSSWEQRMEHVPEPAFCCRHCRENPQCLSWTWFEDAELRSGGSPALCVLKGGLPTGKVPQDGVISGVPFGTEGRVATERRRLEAGGRQMRFGQCGGMFWDGPSECPKGFGCIQRSEFFAQCLPEGAKDGRLGLPPGSKTEVPNVFVHQAVAAAFGGEGVTAEQMCPPATTTTPTQTTTTAAAPIFTVRPAETWPPTTRRPRSQPTMSPADSGDGAVVAWDEGLPAANEKGDAGEFGEDVDGQGAPAGGPILSFYGCYLEMLGSAVASNEQSGYTSSTCSEACGGFVYALLHNGGRCSCSNTKPELSLLSVVDRSLCGEVCRGEEGLKPKRFCGGAQTFAVYEMLQPAGRRLGAAAP